MFASLYSFAATPHYNTDIVLLGDSITHQWGGSKSHDVLGVFPNTPDSDFCLPWKNAFPAYKAINMGVQGDKVEHVLWRLDHGTLDGIRPKVVILAIGTNNTQNVTGFQMPLSSIPEGIKLCVQNIRHRAPQAQIVVVKVLPRNTPTDPLYQNAKLINQGIDALKLDAPCSGVTVLDLWNDFLNPADPNPDKALNTSLFVTGFLHLSEAGYQKYADRLKPLITSFLDGSAPLPNIAAVLPTYLYQPYMNKLLDKQLTGWPLKPDAARYILKVEYNDRLPGSEPGGGGATSKTAFWSITPVARFWRDLKNTYNPFVEVLHRNILEEARRATGQPVDAEISIILNPISKADEAVFITSNQTRLAPYSVVSPNGTFTFSVGTNGYLEITSGALSVWKSTLPSVPKPVAKVSLRLSPNGNLIFNTDHFGGTWGMWASGTYQGGADDNYYGALTNAGQLKIYKGVSPNGALIATFPAPATSTATVTLSGLTQVGDGLAKPISVATSPAGLNSFVTYDESIEPPSAPGVYKVVASISNLNYTGEALGVLTITPAVSAYAAWSLAFGLKGGELGDDDQDGTPNLLEFALGGNPKQSGPPRVAAEYSTADHGVIFCFRRRTAAAGGPTLSYEYSTTLELGSWKTFTPERIDSTPSGDWEDNRLVPPASLRALPQVFMRLRAYL